MSGILRKWNEAASPDIRRWLVPCMVIPVVILALLSGGHAHAFPLAPLHAVGKHVAISHDADHHDPDHAAAADCCNHRAAAAEAECGQCGPACDICVPLPMEVVVSLAADGPAAMSASPVSSPGGLWFLLRPPRLSVTA